MARVAQGPPALGDRPCSLRGPHLGQLWHPRPQGCPPAMPGMSLPTHTCHLQPWGANRPLQTPQVSLHPSSHHPPLQGHSMAALCHPGAHHSGLDVSPPPRDEGKLRQMLQRGARKGRFRLRVPAAAKGNWQLAGDGMEAARDGSWGAQGCRWGHRPPGWARGTGLVLGQNRGEKRENTNWSLQRVCAKLLAGAAPSRGCRTWVKAAGTRLNPTVTPCPRPFAGVEEEGEDVCAGKSPRGAGTRTHSLTFPGDS